MKIIENYNTQDVITNEELNKENPINRITEDTEELTYVEEAVEITEEELFRDNDAVGDYFEQLMGEAAGSVILFVADQTVKRIQRVEQEVRTNLMLQLDISVLSHVCLFPLFLHVAPGCQGVIHHKDYAVYRYFNQQGGSEENRKFTLEMSP